MTDAQLLVLLVLLLAAVDAPRLQRATGRALQRAFYAAGDALAWIARWL